MEEYQLTPQEQQKLNAAINEATDSFIRQDGEVQFRKDVAERMQDELAIKKSDFNALVKERFDEASTKALEKHQRAVEFNEMLVNNCQKSTTAA